MGSLANLSKETFMIKPRIIVTGATGKTGSIVVAELLKAGCPVRAIVHREDGRSARLKSQGAEIVAPGSRLRSSNDTAEPFSKR
jgi:nucleoside-diphosphate-sugar epimerase